MSTLNGIGSKFIGETDFADDGSYITTEYFVVMYVPIYPIQSYRVLESTGDSSFTPFGSTERTKYKVMPIPLHKKSVYPLMIKLWSGFLVTGALMMTAVITENGLLALFCVFTSIVAFAFAFAFAAAS